MGFMAVLSGSIQSVIGVDPVLIRARQPKVRILVFQCQQAFFSFLIDFFLRFDSLRKTRYLYLKQGIACFHFLPLRNQDFRDPHRDAGRQVIPCNILRFRKREVSGQHDLRFQLSGFDRNKQHFRCGQRFHRSGEEETERQDDQDNQQTF